MSKNSKIKFPIHNTHFNKTINNVKVACILSLIAPLCFYLAHNLPKQVKYRNFYTKYDPMDAFDRMQRGGYLESCPAGSGGDAKDDKKKK